MNETVNTTVGAVTLMTPVKLGFLACLLFLFIIVFYLNMFVISVSLHPRYIDKDYRYFIFVICLNDILFLVSTLKYIRKTTPKSLKLLTLRLERSLINAATQMFNFLWL